MLASHRTPIDWLACSQKQFEAIHESVSHTRSTSKNVIVDKAALEALLRDHAKLIDQLERRAA